MVDHLHDLFDHSMKFWIANAVMAQFWEGTGFCVQFMHFWYILVMILKYSFHSMINIIPYSLRYLMSNSVFSILLWIIQKYPVRQLSMTTRKTLLEIWRYISTLFNYALIFLIYIYMCVCVCVCVCVFLLSVSFSSRFLYFFMSRVFIIMNLMFIFFNKSFITYQKKNVCETGWDRKLKKVHPLINFNNL